MRRRIFPILSAVWILLFAVFSGGAPAFASVSSITIDGMTATPSDVFGGGSYVWVDSSGNLQNTSFSWLQQAYPSDQFYLNLAFFDGSVASTPLPTGTGNIPYPSGWSGATSEALTNAGIAFVTVGGAGITATKQNGWFPLMPPAGTASSAYDNPFDNLAASGTTSTTGTSSGTTTSGTTSTSGTGTSGTSSVGGVSGGTGCSPQTVSTIPVSTSTSSSSTGITVTKVSSSSSAYAAGVTFTLTGYNLPLLSNSNGTTATSYPGESAIGYDFPNFALVNNGFAWEAGNSLTGMDSGIFITHSTANQLQFYTEFPTSDGAIFSIYLAPDGQSFSGSAGGYANPPSQYLVGEFNISTGSWVAGIAQAPTLQLISTTSASATLSWDAVPFATSYNIYENGSSSPVETGITGTTTTISGLTSGQTYAFQVAGANSLSTGPMSNVQETIPPVTAPTNLKADNFTQSSFDLTWNNDPGATGYEVFQNGVQIATTTTNTYSVTGQAAGNYSYYVEAIDNCGDITQPSNILQITLNSNQSPVASVQSSGTQGGSGGVSWTGSSSNPAGTTYQVSQNGQPIGTTTGTSMPLSNYDSGSTYAVSAVTPAPTNVVQTPITSGTSGAVSGGTSGATCSGTTITWQPGTGTPTGTVYTVYENGTAIATTTSTSYTGPDCAAGTTYTVSAQAPGYLSSSVLTGSSGSSGSNYGWSCPTPPDWSQIAQQIGKEVWSQAPPIPTPPTGSDTIPTSDAPAITAPDVSSGLGVFTTPSFSVPTTYSGAPSFSVPASNAFTDFTTGYSTISVPTTGSIPFTIGDPNNLPHQAPGTILIPGSGSAVGFSPSNPTLANSSPMPQVAVPSGNMGPSYSGGTALMGTVPAWTDPSSGNPSGPTPTYQGSGISGPSPGAYAGVTPSYSAGVNTGNIPIWSG